jgi:predicted ABC-type ATPase
VNGTDKKPEIIVFAGPNGSGKSTITELLRPPSLDYINADEIQRVLGCDNLEAAKIAENRREEHLKKRESFCFETVLSTDRNLKLLQRAKDAGFFIRCYYVLTADPQINIARVASRVSAGGHDVPTEKIISRYDKALELVHELVPICDVCHIYDNSADAPYRIFKKRKDQCWYCTERHLWLKNDIIALTGINTVEKAALNRHKGS